MDIQAAMTPDTTHPQRMPLAALGKWTVATLAGVLLMLIYLQVVVVRQFSPPLALIFGVPALIVAVLLVVTRWRWAPLLGVLYWVLLNAMNLSHISYDIVHPESFTTFAFTVILLALSVVGIAAGVGATVQNYRAPKSAAADNGVGRRRVPGWFRLVPWSLAGLSLGALLIGALPRANPGGAVSAETLASLPVLSVANFHFGQTELRVKAGEVVALRLENRDNTAHSFDIDELNVHVPIGLDGPGLALFTPNKPGAYTYYCSVPGHRGMGMVGTLIVEP